MLKVKGQIILSHFRNIYSKIFQQQLVVSIFVLILAGVLGFNLWFLFGHNSQSPTQSLIGSSNLSQPSETGAQGSGSEFSKVLATATQSATPSAQPVSLFSGRITIALLGDSMIDTLGDLANLKQNLSQFYPKVEFNLLNYGVGSTRPTDGLARLTTNTTTPTKQLQPLLIVKPDIVVIETFSYNHRANIPEDIAAHYQKIAEIVDTLSRSNIKVMFLATIAPTTNFAKGAPGILWDENRQRLEAETVMVYLRSGINFAKNNNLALIDAFNPSLGSDGTGKQIYVNTADNIHPSPEGAELVSDLIAQKIISNAQIEKVLHP